MPKPQTKTVCAHPKKNLRQRLDKPEFAKDRNRRMPWTLQLLQAVYFMAQESTIQCKLKKSFFFTFWYSKLKIRFSRNCVFKVGCQNFSATTQPIFMKFCTGLRDTILENLDEGFFFLQLQLFKKKNVEKI